METRQRNFLQRIGEAQAVFSPKQRVLADYMVHHYLSLAYVTVSELAQRAGVSGTTVVRFVYSLGYDGFADFMDALREEIDRTQREKDPGMSRYTFDRNDYAFPRDAFRAIFTLEIKIMEDTLAAIDEKDFERAVEAILRAPDLVIAAWGSNKAHSQAAAFAFEVLHPRVHKIEELGLSEAALLRSLPKEAAALVFSSPRYPTATQEILKVLKERGVYVIGFSDSVLSPILPFCDVLFQVPEEYVTFIDTNAAYMAFIHALAFGLYLKDVDRAKQRIEAYNTFSRRQGFYLHGFQDLIDFYR